MLCSKARVLIRNSNICRRISISTLASRFELSNIETPSNYSQLKPYSLGFLYQKKLVTPNLGSSCYRRRMASQSEKPQSIYDFTVKDAKGNDVDLSKYKGKVLLIVNVASECGLTNSNYPELSKLYEKYKDQGLEILAFPCNQFGNQEPGNNEQIVEFACTRFKAEFPIFDKVDVNGENANPLYKFLKSSKGGLFSDSIKWNFAKFLVNKEGIVVSRHAPTTSPLSFETEIKKLLGVA